MTEHKRRRLITNPYEATIEQAMDRLGKLESAIRENTATANQEKSRTLSKYRRTIRKGFTANQDLVGWHAQIGAQHDLLLKRITVVAVTQLSFMLLVGNTNNQAVREFLPSTEFYAVTFQNGSTGFCYSDAFSNEIYVRGNDDLYVHTADGSPTTHTFQVLIEAEEYVTHERYLSENEITALDYGPERTSRDDPDSEENQNYAGDGIDVDDAHLVNDADGDPHVGNTDNDTTSTFLVPDAAAHLPPALPGSID
jgi:hypothetical protein